jgi:hypothetical protein
MHFGELRPPRHVVNALAMLVDDPVDGGSPPAWACSWWCRCRLITRQVQQGLFSGRRRRETCASPPSLLIGLARLEIGVAQTREHLAST